MPDDRSSPCPAVEKIERLVLGELDDHVVREHVGSCPTCRETAARLRGNNSFLKGFFGTRARRPLGQNAAPGDQAIPGYEIISEIHRGGQGVVYKALQKTTRRQVALKMLIHGAFATSAQRGRFEREIELAAGLRHPHIVTVYDSGTTPDGRNYFAMEYIDGAPLSETIARGRGVADSAGQTAPVDQTLRLFIKLCNAVGYAHQHGVIHRDLKPANIIIDAEGEPHIVDFGVAKPFGSGSAGDIPAATAAGGFLGTFAYAAPEQINGDPSQIDTRTDVYALGLILYEMLTGAHPYPVEGTLSDVLRNIAEAEPANPAALRRDLDHDVGAILLKALEKDRARRYQSALELSQDITRHLTGQPVDARNRSTWYVLRKTVQRHRVALSLAAGFLSLIVGFAVDRGIQARRLGRVAAELEIALNQATIERGVAEVRAGNSILAETLFWREHLNPPVFSGRRGGAAEPSRSQPLIHSHWALWELYSRQACLATWKAHRGVIRAVRFSPDGTILASGGSDGIRLWEMPSRRLLHAHPNIGAVWSLCFSPDGRLLASGGEDGEEVRVWNVAEGSLRARFPGHGPRPSCVAFSPDGALLASSPGFRSDAVPRASGSQADRTIRLWDVATRRSIQVIDVGGQGMTRVSFDPKGDTLAATVERSGTIRLFSVPEGRLLASLEGDYPLAESVAFSPDGETLIAAGRFSVQLWRIASRDLLSGFRAHDDWVHSVGFSPDGRWFATTSSDQTVKIWDAESGKLAHSYSGSTGFYSHCFGPSGDIVVTGAENGTISLWETHPCRYRRSFKQNLDVHCVRYSSDGRLLAASGGNGDTQDWGIRLWDTTTAQQVGVLRGHTSYVSAIAFGHHDRVLASASYDRTLRLWDVTTGQCLVGPLEGHKEIISAVAFSTNGRWLATGDNGGAVRVWDAETGRCVHTFETLDTRVPWVCFSPDGELLASCGSAGSSITGKGMIVIHHLGSRQIYAVLEGHKQFVRSLCFSPDGRTLASGSDDRVIKLWDVSTGRCLGDLTGHKEDIFSLSFSPDGRMLASSTRGNDIKLWDVETHRCLATLEGHQDMVFSVCFHPNGRTLASGSRDRTVGLWDLTYYDRHIAGNLEYQIERLPPEDRDEATVEQLRAWAADVRARPSRGAR